MFWAQKRSVHQNVERIATRRCGRWIGNRRRGEIAGGVRRGLGEIVNVMELFVGVAGKNEVMVRQMLIPLVQPEVEHNAGTCGFILSALVEVLRSRTAEQ